MLNGVGIDKTVGELIKKIKKNKANWMKFNMTSIKIQLLSLITTLNY